MEQIVPLLEQLAAQMNTTVEFLWDVLVRQARVSAIGQIILYALSIIVAFILVYYILPWLHTRYNEEMEKASYDRQNEDAYAIGMIAIGILVFLVTVGFILTVPQLITKLANPEYWALQQILEFIK